MTERATRAGGGYEWYRRGVVAVAMCPDLGHGTRALLVSRARQAASSA